MIRKFLASRSANLAVMASLLFVPLCLAVGLSVDHARHLSAQKHLQELADAASLALAAGNERDNGRLEDLANRFLESNRNSDRVRQMRVMEIDASPDNIDLSIAGALPTTFMRIAGIETMNVMASALAERAVSGRVEVALILDNTWSMSDTDHTGVRRIDALKVAAKRLIGELLRRNGDLVRVGLVPYSDYVNIGPQYRNAPWLDVEPDRDIRHGEEVTCRTYTTRDECRGRTPQQTCTHTVDGVTESYECGGQCTRWETVEVQPYSICDGGYWTDEYRFRGCVGSRVGGTNRLTVRGDQKYPGLSQTRQACVTPIVRLTNDRARLERAIDELVIEGHYYRPETYIPAGVVWGWNVLDPHSTFADAAPYDPHSMQTKKVAVIMTDGANTLQYSEEDNHNRTRREGRHHVTWGSPATVAAQVGKTNADTLAICSNMKDQGIEIFTVAFMVEDDVALNMLRACSTNETSHFFDATDSSALLSAFEGIGHSLRMVRLAR